jgi:Major Facilitator Superfamily
MSEESTPSSGQTDGPAYSSFSHSDVMRVMSGAMICILLAALDQTVVIPALPSIASDLGAYKQLSWIVAAYLITSTISTPIYGKLSDIYGRRRPLTTFGAETVRIVQEQWQARRIEEGDKPVEMGAEGHLQSTLTRLAAVQHRVHLIISAISFSPAKLLDALDEDFAVGIVALLEPLHDFRNVFVEGHRVRIPGLVGSGQLSLNIRWNELKHLNSRLAELNPQRLHP